MPEIELAGCTPEPLMSYLKALGVLRAVASQLDPTTRGYWRSGQFVLVGDSLSRDLLIQFFAGKFAPTPIAAPWAGGSGFFGKDNRSAVDALAASVGERTRSYRDVIARVRKTLSDLGLTEKPTEEAKDELLRRYRREMPDNFIEWMDAAIVIQDAGQSFPPILGTGGNDGRLDFTQNFMQRVVGLRLHDEGPDDAGVDLVRQAFFGDVVSEMATAAVGQFAPGRAGGPNSSQGFGGSSSDNPWDFLMAIEGTLLLSGAVARRLGTGYRDKAAFPFTVRASAVGFDSASDVEASDARGEIWLPLWVRPATLGEIRAIFGEGRAELSGRQSRDGVDFARAIAGLGIDRGVRSFVRYGFLKRSGKAFLAPALGMFDVTSARNDVSLFCEIDPWLDRFRAACRDDTTPARFRSALRRLDATIFGYSRHSTAHAFGNVVRALGNAERELAASEKFRNDERRPLRPLSGLSGDWVRAADDGSVEFELALALAGVRDPERRIGPLRTNLEPFDWERRSAAWSDRGPGVVWSAGDLAANLAAVLRRRVIDAGRSAGERLPVHNERSPAGLKAVAAFLAGDFDQGKLEELLWGLLAVDQEHLERRSLGDRADVPLPRAYALLKLLFLPHAIGRDGDERVTISTEPEVIPLLRRGDPASVRDACTVAMRRLRAVGFEPLPHRQSGRAARDSEWTETSPVVAGRIAAALLFPIGGASAAKLLEMVTRDPTDESDEGNSGGRNAAEREPEGAI